MKELEVEKLKREIRRLQIEIKEVCKERDYWRKRYKHLTKEKNRLDDYLHERLQD